MPNGVPYDGSSYNNDLGPGAYPANITHGTYFSSVVNAVTGYSIYLPPEYATNPNQRFNVIYFLTGQGFGSGATENSEVTTDPELISNLRLIPPTIMVFPNPYQNSKYMDAAPGSSMSGIEMFESQFINELIPFIDANYRTQASRDGRAIMGFSGGGQGALRLAFKYPALFSSVEGMSGAVDDNASNVAVNEPQLLAAMFNGDANAFDVQTANGQAKADRANIIASESVRKHQAGLQSFRSMRRIEASRRNASALRLRFSQSFASLRQRLSQAKVRSTTQRRGSTTNPFVRSERLTISVSSCGKIFAKAF